MLPAEQTLQQFREQLYQHFDKRADTLMELVDARSSLEHAHSPAEYSLAPCFRRGYSEMYKGIAAYAAQAASRPPHWLALATPLPQSRGFWLFGVDVTPHPRPHAPTLADRGIVHAPNPAPGNRPIVVGHEYSLVACLPEVEPGVSRSWVIPLSVQRVASTDDKELTGAQQLQALLGAPAFPWHEALKVVVADSSYSKPRSLCAFHTCPDTVTITRLRSNRVLYLPPEPVEKPPRGHPRWYGARFALADTRTWPTPDESVTRTETGARGETYRVEIQAWRDIRMRGQRGCPMHLHPFTLLRVVVYNAQGQPVFRKPLWLAVCGARRAELPPVAAYQAYRQRPRLEHYFRFGKQHLQMGSFQTSDAAREAAWQQLTLWAYLQLWLARTLVNLLPRPWERYLPGIKSRRVTPTLVQRDFGRIIRQLGSPAQAPKPRGKAPGRAPGTRLAPKPRFPLVVKGKKRAPTTV